MTVLEIVTEYLRAHGYDGLYHDECGCRLDDLFPCSAPCEDCRPGVKMWDEDHSEWGVGPKEGE